MATLSLSSTTSSVTARLSGISVTEYPRSFEFTLYKPSGGADYYERSLAAGSTTSSISHTFSGLSSDTEYSVYLEVYNSTTGRLVATFSDSISTKVEAYRVYVTTYLDGIEYDSKNGNYTVQTQTVSTWKSSLNVSTPAGSFSYGEYSRGSTSGSCTLSTELRNTNILYIELYYESPRPVILRTLTASSSIVNIPGEVTFNWTYTGIGSSSENFELYYTTDSTHYYKKSIAYPATNTNFSFPTGSQVGIWEFYVTYSGDRTTSTNKVFIEVTNNPPTTGKAYIYTGTGPENGWTLATPYIWNGSTWVEAEPNLFDGGTWK